MGIDFDPFLASQDPAKRYVVGAVYRRGRYVIAEIHAVDHGFRDPKPDLRVELSRRGGSWVCVNFLYPGMGNLLSILRPPRPKCSAPRKPAAAKGLPRLP